MDIGTNGAPGRHVRRAVDAAVCIDAELFHEVRTLAALRGESVRDVVARALTAYAQGRSGAERRCSCPPDEAAAPTPANGAVRLNGRSLQLRADSA